jgi:hypothetical protein
MSAKYAGIYRFLVIAEGVTYKGVPFSREQLLTGAVFHEIKDPPPRDQTGQTGTGGGGGKDDLCRLLACLLGGKVFSKDYEDKLKKQGISLEAIRECVKAFCQKPG